MNATPTLFDAIDEATPGFHVGDPWTSKAAARTVAVNAGTARYRVLDALIGATDAPALGGLTDYELGARLGMLATAAGTRRGELVAAGYAEPAALTRPTDTGRDAEVHRATLAGRVALRVARAARPELATAAHTASHGARPPGRPSGAVVSRYGLTTARDRVLEELAAAPIYGATAYELGQRIGILRTAAGTAVKQLVAAGLAEPTGGTRPTDRRHAAIVYRITVAGVARFRELAPTG